MTDQMNGPALRDLASVVRRIAERRADVISAYEVANLEIADEQLNRFADRIERPVPTAECTGDWRCGAALHVHGCFEDHGECDSPAEHPINGVEPSVPTREQIAEALHRSDESTSYDPFDYERGADAVLTLLNGADR